MKGTGFSPYINGMADLVKGTGFSPYIKIAAAVKGTGFSPYINKTQRRGL